MKLMLLPAGLRFADPVALIATWFGSGLMPKAPGTWGSLAAVICFVIFSRLSGGPLALIIGAASSFVIVFRPGGLALCGREGHGIGIAVYGWCWRLSR